MRSIQNFVAYYRGILSRKTDDKPQEKKLKRYNELTVMFNNATDIAFNFKDWEGTDIWEPWTDFYKWLREDTDKTFLFKAQHNEVVLTRKNILYASVKVMER